MSVRGMRVRTRIVFALGVALLPLLFVGATGVIALKRSAHGADSAVSEQVEESLAITRTRDHLIQAEFWAIQYVNEGQSSAKSLFNRLVVSIDNDFEELLVLDSKEEREHAAEAQSEWLRSLVSAQSALELPPGSSATEDVYPLQRFHGPIARSIGLLVELNLSSLDDMRQDAASITAQGDQQSMIFVISFAASILFLIFIARRLSQGILHPLRKLEQAAELYGEDQLDHRVVIESTDELGRLGDALNDMASKLERTRKDLNHSQKMDALGQLAGGVAHDFNNELSIIQNYADFVASDLQANPSAVADLNEIRRAAARAASLSRRLLLFARKEVTHSELVSPDQVLGDFESMLRRLLTEKINASVNLGAPDAVVQVDPSQLEQVLINLAINAKDAMPDGGSLEIATSVSTSTPGLDRPESILITMTDSGKGMSEETLARVFEPFFTTKPEGSGTGLGLAMSQQIVTGAGGTIGVESELGHGCRFNIRLPLAADGETPSSTEADVVGPEPSEAVERIMIAEDQEALRHLVSRILEKQGFLVTVAANGVEALQLFEEGEEIDLLLSDVVMPGMSGLDLARRVRERRPDLPVILMSGHIPDEQDRKTIEQGSMAFIGKPFSADILLQQVQAQLQNRSLSSPA
jgi:signal transduction histidine kinase/ActR/RegA family two-component response regulator